LILKQLKTGKPVATFFKAKKDQYWWRIRQQQWFKSKWKSPLWFIFLFMVPIYYSPFSGVGFGTLPCLPGRLSEGH